ncbi:hypothetical protein C8Q72DRAFT_941471 [Fomitopsis betulina]|nr:hypothetical protein C8Q72DRAFT_941471 [Fomitopsis betulina]
MNGTYAKIEQEAGHLRKSSRGGSYRDRLCSAPRGGDSGPAGQEKFNRRGAGVGRTSRSRSIALVQDDKVVSSSLGVLHRLTKKHDQNSITAQAVATAQLRIKPGSLEDWRHRNCDCRVLNLHRETIAEIVESAVFDDDGQIQAQVETRGRRGGEQPAARCWAMSDVGWVRSPRHDPARHPAPVHGAAASAVNCGTPLVGTEWPLRCMSSRTAYIETGVVTIPTIASSASCCPAPFELTALPDGSTTGLMLPAHRECSAVDASSESGDRSTHAEASTIARRQRTMTIRPSPDGACLPPRHCTRIDFHISEGHARHRTPAPETKIVRQFKAHTIGRYPGTSGLLRAQLDCSVATSQPAGRRTVERDRPIGSATRGAKSNLSAAGSVLGKVRPGWCPPYSAGDWQSSGRRRDAGAPMPVLQP